MTIYAIRVKTMTNAHLAQWGWRVGQYVRLITTGTGSQTFEPCWEGKDGTTVCYTNKAYVGNLVKKITDRFSQVTFEVVEFTSK